LSIAPSFARSFDHLMYSSSSAFCPFPASKCVLTKTSRIHSRQSDDEDDEEEDDDDDDDDDDEGSISTTRATAPFSESFPLRNVHGLTSLTPQSESLRRMIPICW